MQLTETIKNELSGEWHSFEVLMKSALDSDNDLLNRINSYLLDHAGKKLRPMLALLSAAACSGAVNDDAVACAAAAEIMHTATLLHDDVVDESDLRRGQLTVRSMFSPGASVLMGDYWLSKSVSLLLGIGNMEIIGLFSKTIEDLAYGEMLQMEKADRLDTTQKDYFEIIRCKTASLFVSAIVSAAIASGADRACTDALGDYALNLGLMFQIRDDILDYSDSDSIGKDADCDISERKMTLPLLCALDNAPGRRRQIVSLLSDMEISDPTCDRNREIVRAVKAFVSENDGIPSARRRMDAFCARAVSALDPLPRGRYRDCLASAAGALSAD